MAFLGVGSMNGAILAGVLANTSIHATTTNRSVAKAEALGAKWGDRITALAEETTADANLQAIADADVIVIGVKPYQVAELLAEIGPHLKPHTVLISVAAGITLDAMRTALGTADVELVRAMPNTPALVGKAVTGLAPEPNAATAAVSRAREIFETVGQVVMVDEDGLDKLGTISGSGPAYFYLFTETLAAAAEQLGFDAKTAALLAEGTLVGSAKLLEATGESPETLRVRVTSPGGTTAEALATYRERGLAEITAAAADAALRRTHEIASEG